MAVSPERLERYRDFVDPDKTGAPYNPRQGLERLLGVLSPDPKGVVLAAMGQDWYGSESKLQSMVFSFLKELDLPTGIWPLTLRANWSYLESKDKRSGQIIDGSLVDLGAVVKKVEPDPFRVFYQRSLGSELALPLVQQAVMFVPRAREYAERQKLLGKESPKFDSMWRIIGSVQSRTELRRPLSVFDIIEFLVHNSGQHREKDILDQTKISQGRLTDTLSSLSDCGIIGYISPQTDKEGQKGKGWVVYTLVNSQDAADLTPDNTYQAIRNIESSFFRRSSLAKIIDHIKEYPDDEYEHRALAKKLNIRLDHASNILSLLAGVDILTRPDPGLKGGEVQTSAEANSLTHLFYELVCAPAKETADTLSPLPLRPWHRQEIAVYLQNYDEERSNSGPQGGEDARSLLLRILSQAGGEMKMSYVVDLYNERAGTKLQDTSLSSHLRMLLGMSLVEQPKPGYYRLVKG